MEEKENLFSEFSPVSTQQWMDKIAIDLKGADFEKKLVWKTNEGFKVMPFYREEDITKSSLINALPNEFPYLRGEKKDSNSWLVRQDIPVSDPQQANAKALDILKKGVDSIGFCIETENISSSLISSLLKDIYPTAIELNFSVPEGTEVKFAEYFTNYLKQKEIDPQKIHGSICYDPLMQSLCTGTKANDFAETAIQLLKTTADFPHLCVIEIHPVVLSKAGAYIYQELGYALAWGKEYLQQMIDSNCTADEVAEKMKFNFGISSNYFMEIAKFRAARLLWSEIVAAYGLQNKERAKMLIHAITATFNQTLYDSYVNLLRSQTEAMSAALGGISSMTITPFDTPYETPTEFSERLARNQQLLLKEESHFDTVVDPAAGSYYVETLTTSIAEQAWKLFLEIEEDGGFYQAICRGAIQEKINASGNARRAAIAKRRESLLGTNQFPNFGEQAKKKKPLTPMQVKQTSIPTLCFERGASAIEVLRMQVEKAVHRPKAFMLTIGNITMRQARSQFSCNYLACAGYEVIDNLGFETLEEGIKAALDIQADIVVICSSDDEYATYAIPAYEALKENAIVIVAGNPPCAEELKAAGLQFFIHVRTDMLETLKELNNTLGIN